MCWGHRVALPHSIQGHCPALHYELGQNAALSSSTEGHCPALYYELGQHTAQKATGAPPPRHSLSAHPCDRDERQWALRGQGQLSLADPRKESDCRWPLATAFGGQGSFQIPVAMLWDSTGRGQAKCSRPSPHQGLAQPPACTAQREENRWELEALQAQLEGERFRSQELQRCWAAKRRELQEAAERERQLLADQLHCAWEKQQIQEEQRLKEWEQRQREAVTRQLLRWKEAELQATKELLQRECDAALRQARELQKQLAEVLRSPRRSSRVARAQLQDALSKLRWETDGEQPACIRHLQHQLELERRLFNQYIVGRWESAPHHTESHGMSCSQDREGALGRHRAEQGSSRPAVKDAHVQVPETAKEGLGLPGSRPSPRQGLAQPPASPVQREEHSQELKALQAQLEGERLRSQELQHCWAAERRELQEAAERERQRLADQLRSKWEWERASKLQRLREQSQRQWNAEIRQLLQVKEAQLRQMQEQLQKQRNDTVRQAWHLQRQLVEELLRCGSSRGDRGMQQEVQRQLCWKSRREQAAHVLRLRRELQEQRRRFLQYILEHGEGQPPASCNGARACRRAVAEVGVQAAEQQEACPPERRELQEQNAHLLRELKDLQRQCSLLGEENCLLRNRSSQQMREEVERLKDKTRTLSLLTQQLRERVRQLKEASSTSREATEKAEEVNQLQGQHLEKENETAEEDMGFPGSTSSKLLEQRSCLQRALGNLERQCQALKAQNHLLREGRSPEVCQELQTLQQAGAKLGVLSKRMEEKCRQLQETAKKLRPHGNPKQECSNPQEKLEESEVWPMAVCSVHSHRPTSPLIRRFLARHSYSPFESPNENPENELPLTAGQYVYIFGEVDEDGWFLGELTDGTRGLVPSNLVEEVSDDDLDTTVPPELHDLLLDTDDEERPGSKSSGRK